MKRIHYIKGDATSPKENGNRIIAHICNDIGGWGKGFVMAISKKWKEPENEYRNWFQSKENFGLGKIQVVKVGVDVWVANMIGQHKVNTASDGIPPIRYEAVEECLERLSLEAERLRATIHMPRIGCGLAGGKWEEIEPIINKTMLQKNIAVYVYDLD